MNTVFIEVRNEDNRMQEYEVYELTSKSIENLHKFIDYLLSSQKEDSNE